jgi:hypothetical protein
MKASPCMRHQDGIITIMANPLWLKMRFSRRLSTSI